VQGGASVYVAHAGGQQSSFQIDMGQGIPLVLDFVGITQASQISCPPGQRFEPTQRGCVVDSSQLQYGLKLKIMGQGRQCEFLPGDRCDFSLDITLNGQIVEHAELSENSDVELYDTNQSFREGDLISGAIVVRIFDRDKFSSRDHLGSCSVRFTKEDTFRTANGQMSSRHTSCDKVGFDATIFKR
jgi:hypothetical protein